MAIEVELEAGHETLRCLFPRDTAVQRGDEVRLGFETRDAVVLRDERLDEDEEETEAGGAAEDVTAPGNAPGTL